MNGLQIVSRVTVQGACAVAAWNGYAFVGAKSDGVYGIDLTNPAAPVLRGRLHAEGMDARRLFVDRGRLFVAAFGGGVHVYDVTNPAAPFPVTQFASAAIPYVEDVVAHGRYAFVTGADGVYGRFAVVDVLNPGAASVIALHTNVAQENAGYVGVAYDGRSILAGTQRGDVHMLDTSNAGRIVRTGEYICGLGSELRPAKAWGVAATPGRAYVADAGAGLVVIDTRNPTNPRQLTAFQLPTPIAIAYRVVLLGSVVYVATGWGGLLVLDVTNLGAIRVLHELAPPQASYMDVCLFGPFALAANGGATPGLDVIRVRL